MSSQLERCERERRPLRPEPRRIALPQRGVEIALLDWGGDGPSC
ncbi:MAG: hypothetical protein M5U32_07330 [Myxococcota bacterium]|nr:hypothetical protein [Myxococcota bacterium]